MYTLTLLALVLRFWVQYTASNLSLKLRFAGTLCVRNGIKICCSFAQKSLFMKEVIIAWQICSAVIKVRFPTTEFPPKVAQRVKRFM